MSVSVPGHSGMGSSSSASASAVDDDVSAGGINGMTIKEILEKVDLFNVAVEDDDPEDPAKQEKVLVGKPKVLYKPGLYVIYRSYKGQQDMFYSFVLVESRSSWGRIDWGRPYSPCEKKLGPASVRFPHTARQAIFSFCVINISSCCVNGVGLFTYILRISTWR